VILGGWAVSDEQGTPTEREFFIDNLMVRVHYHCDD
jgi:hypothetical protein